MNEKAYRTMTLTGAANIVIGVVSIVAGAAVGVLALVSGAKLLKAKKGLTF